MSERKHTPGPWKIVNGQLIATPDGTILCDTFDFVAPRRAEAAANARLIAASPLMYDYIRAHAVAGCEQAAAILRAVEGTETT